MSLANYGVLKGKAIGAKREDDESSPHYQVHILARRAQPHRGQFQVPVEPVRAAVLGKRQFPASVHGASSSLGGRLHPLQRAATGGGLDYIRANLFNRWT